MSDEAIDAACKGKSRKVKAALRSYYADLNYILDGWRTADVIVDSQFPAEVLRRFGTMQEVEEALGRAKKYEKHPGVGVARRVDMLGGRTSSHTGLMHLLSSSTPDGGRSPYYAATSSDDEDSPGPAQTSRRVSKSAGQRRQVSLDEEAGRPHGQRRGSLGTRAANAFGLGWLRSSDAALKQRTQSEDESGFDSDSEPEPTEAGPQPRKAGQARGERQRLLDGQERRGRREGPTEYGSATQQNGSGLPATTAVRATTPAGREAAALEGPQGSEEVSAGYAARVRSRAHILPLSHRAHWIVGSRKARIVKKLANKQRQRLPRATPHQTRTRTETSSPTCQAAGVRGIARRCARRYLAGRRGKRAKSDRCNLPSTSTCECAAELPALRPLANIPLARTPPASSTSSSSRAKP